MRSSAATRPTPRLRRPSAQAGKGAPPRQHEIGAQPLHVMAGLYNKPAMTMWRVAVQNQQSVFASQPQIKPLDQIVVVELFGRAALERDLAVHDDVAAVGDAQRLREVLLRHQT